MYLQCESQAEQRARALLLEYLSPGQRQTFEQSGYFDIDKTGSKRSASMRLRLYPKFRVYRLFAGRHPVVLFTSARRWQRSAPKYCYCIHGDESVPRHDDLLSLKLLIDHDEPRFVATGNRFRIFGRRPVPPMVDMFGLMHHPFLP